MDFERVDILDEEDEELVPTRKVYAVETMVQRGSAAFDIAEDHDEKKPKTAEDLYRDRKVNVRTHLIYSLLNAVLCSILTATKCNVFWHKILLYTEVNWLFIWQYIPNLCTKLLIFFYRRPIF